MRCTQTTTIVSVEELHPLDQLVHTLRLNSATYLVEPHVIAEVRVTIELRVPSIICPSALTVATEDMDDAMLNFFSDVRKVHIITATRRAFHLYFVTVVLVESLK